MRQKPPTLVYFKRESDIERLVEMRMKPGNPIKSKDYHFQCSSSAGMSEKVAAKLDGILHQHGAGKHTARDRRTVDFDRRGYHRGDRRNEENRFLQIAGSGFNL